LNYSEKIVEDTLEKNALEKIDWNLDREESQLTMRIYPVVLEWVIKPVASLYVIHVFP
jgi:hypothetical protein